MPSITTNDNLDKQIADKTISHSVHVMMSNILTQFIIAKYCFPNFSFRFVFISLPLFHFTFPYLQNEPFCTRTNFSYFPFFFLSIYSDTPERLSHTHWCAIVGIKCEVYFTSPKNEKIKQ